MIGLQIINLLSEDELPYIFAKEFDHVESIREAWSVS